MRYKLTNELIEEIMQWTELYKESSADRLLLGSNKVPKELKPLVATQLEVRKKWKRKYPSLFEKPFFLPHTRNFEQASSEATARFKSQFIKGDVTLVDLTGGAGIDFLFMSQKAGRAYYIEKDSEVALATEYNLRHYDTKLPPLSFVVGDALESLQSLATESDLFLYCDPSRRAESGKRTFLLEDISPNPIELLERLQQMHQRTSLLLKLSPLMDLEALVQSLPSVSEVYILEAQGEVKEILAFIPDIHHINTNPLEEVSIKAIDLSSQGEVKNSFSFLLAEEKRASTLYSSTIKKYLYYPAASLLKAGAFKKLAEYYSLEELHPNSHLYTSDHLVANFLGKAFIVKEAIPFAKNKVKQLKKSYSKADFSVRNFPLPAEELRRITRIASSDSCRIFATTILPSKAIFIVTEPL